MVEFLKQMSADANWQVELLDEWVIERTDPALAVQQQLPRSLRVGRERGRHGDAGDDYVGKAFPVTSSVIGLANVPSISVRLAPASGGTPTSGLATRDVVLQ